MRKGERFEMKRKSGICSGTRANTWKMRRLWSKIEEFAEHLNINVSGKSQTTVSSVYDKRDETDKNLWTIVE